MVYNINLKICRNFQCLCSIISQSHLQIVSGNEAESEMYFLLKNKEINISFIKRSASALLPSLISSEQQYNLRSDALSALNIIHGGVDAVNHLDCIYNLRYRRQRIGYEPGNSKRCIQASC